MLLCPGGTLLKTDCTCSSTVCSILFSDSFDFEFVKSAICIGHSAQSSTHDAWLAYANAIERISHMSSARKIKCTASQQMSLLSLPKHVLWRDRGGLEPLFGRDDGDRLTHRLQQAARRLVLSLAGCSSTRRVIGDRRGWYWLPAAAYGPIKAQE